MYKYKYVNNQDKEDERDVILDDSDKLFRDLKTLHIGDVFNRITELKDEFLHKDKTAKARLKKGEKDLVDAKNIMRGIEMFQRRLREINVHDTIATEINKSTRARGLTELGDLEQELIYGEKANSKTIKKFLEGKGGKARNCSLGSQKTSRSDGLSHAATDWADLSCGRLRLAATRRGGRGGSCSQRRSRRRTACACCCATSERTSRNSTARRRSKSARPRCSGARPFAGPALPPAALWRAPRVVRSRAAALTCRSPLASPCRSWQARIGFSDADARAILNLEQLGAPPSLADPEMAHVRSASSLRRGVAALDPRRADIFHTAPQGARC